MLKKLVMLLAAVVAVGSAAQAPVRDLPQPPCYPCQL